MIDFEKPKYSVGQKLHSWSDGLFLEITIVSIDRDLDAFVYRTNDMGGWSLTENALFTSKAALIDAQLEYWEDLRNDIQRHQPGLDADRCQQSIAENSTNES